MSNESTNGARCRCGKSPLRRQRVHVELHPLGRAPEILLVDDGIAVKHLGGPVPADHHCHVLRDPGPDHVAHGRAPEIVEDFALDPGLAAGGIPALLDAAEWLAPAMALAHRGLGQPTDLGDGGN